MIPLTRLDGSEVTVNADLIELLEARPDTTVTLTTGRKILVRESVDEVVERIVAYRDRLRRSGGRRRKAQADGGV